MEYMQVIQKISIYMGKSMLQEIRLVLSFTHEVHKIFPNFLFGVHLAQVL